MTGNEEYPADILDVPRQSALGGKRKGMNFLNENIPAAVGIEHMAEDASPNDRDQPSTGFLVNTSGTGKTRLPFEGLCLHWGFYPTCAIDTSYLGAGDLPSVVNEIDWDSEWNPRLPSTSDAHYTSSLQGNLRLVYRAVSLTLLAPLIVFKMYLDACAKEGFCLEQRQRWLESQTFPRNILPSFDSFGMLKYTIGKARPSAEDLDEAILHLLDEVQSLWEMSAAWPFEDQHGHYPILKEILRGLRRRMGHLPVEFVVAGTMIPEDHFQSTVSEWDDFRWCSDTGSLDNPEEHHRYVSQFMPPEFTSSSTGQALLDRMWNWLRGRFGQIQSLYAIVRHRYAASFLAVLLHNNFHSPYPLLGSYIGRFTEYIPHDNVKYPEGEGVRYNDWDSPLGSKGLGLCTLAMLQYHYNVHSVLSLQSLGTMEMHRTATSFLSASTGCTDCLTTDRILITEDYGYFIDPDCAQIALDEPLTVTYGTGWLKQNLYFGFVKFIRIFCKRSEVDIHPTHFALFLALSFASLLDHLCKTSYAFNIMGLSSSLPQVKFVTFTRVASRLEAVDVHLWEDAYDKLVLMASTPEQKLSWFKHKRNEPFCALLSSSSTSVILVFCLQLADARCFWVFVLVSSKSMKDANHDLVQDIQNLHPNKVFRDQPEILPLLSNLPNPCLNVGAFGVLRISGSWWPEKATADSIPAEHLPAGVLNIAGLAEAGKKVSREMLMRRLSQIIAQEQKKKKKPEPAPLPTTIGGNHPKKGRKRGRSQTIADDTGARKSKIVKSAEEDATVAGSSRRKKCTKSTNVDTVLGSSSQSGKTDKTSRGTLRVGKVATGRASTEISRSDRIESTASSSSTSAYNLRKR
ncbi:hypothetical protein J3R30DRAFT_3732932 [Lentinula aciculospora]|uniref:Uncharacterized protein n=1 Tax=Lentinula aciculospora TaxID=153920 RepID=A0A9W9DQ92_9AGAR|nr:hypothetical protein J3R30DRAFT_3732932 [Lentinula aciculospora]